MNVLMTTHPGYGHLHPMIPVAQALQSAGHQVVFACAPSFCEHVQRLGFNVLPVGFDWLEWEAADKFPEMENTLLAQRHDWLLTNVFSDIAAHEMTAGILALANTWRPDVIVRGSFEFGACVAAERLEIPHATIGIGLFFSPGMLEPRIGDQLAYLRSAYGLEPYPALDMLYRNLYLSYFPAVYEFPDIYLPPVNHIIRPTLFSGGEQMELPANLRALLQSDRPNALVTLGTIFNRTVDIYRTIMDGLRDENINLIITVGRNQNITQFGTLPDNVYITHYIPYNILLPHCQLVMMHGGTSTTLASLAHGLPVIVIPLSADQPFHAMRCAALKAGRVLKYDHQFDDLLGSEHAPFTADSVRQTVRDVLGNPDYRQNAQHLKDAISQQPTPDLAVDLLQKIVLSFNRGKAN
jgi:UDP:flavonoid glycosyltransferase YjiC (YdhE family)